MHRIQRRRRRAAMLAALAMAASTVVFTQWLPASAAVTGSNFEIEDGNLKLDGADPDIDWASVTEARQPDLDSGSGDDSFGQGAAEDTTCPSVVDGSIPPNKSDLKTFGLFVEENTAGQFLHMFWTRVQNPSGTTNMDFEFNQKDPAEDPCLDPRTGTAGNDGTTPERTAGDVLISYNLSQGGTVPSFFLSRWVTTSSLTPKNACEAANAFPCWGKKVELLTTGASADAAGSVNESAIPFDESDGLIDEGQLDPFTFGEGTVDLDAVFPDDECVNFGNAYLKSRSSDSFTAALKDFIRPLDFTLTNCGSIEITKDDGTNALLGSRFTLYENNTPTASPIGTEDTVVTTGVEGTLNAAITATATSIVLESGDGADFPTGESVIKIGNELILVSGRTGDTFTVATGGRGYAGTTAAAHADEATVEGVVSCAPSGTDAECTMINILFGEYWLVETTVPAGYTGSGPVAVTVEDTETVQVTISNNAAPVDLTVHKQTDDDATAPTPVPICFEDDDTETTTGDITTGCAEFELYARTTTALAEAVDADEDAIDVDDATGFTAGDEIVIHGSDLSNAEFVTIDSVSGDTLNVTRDADTPAHADGALVSLVDFSGTPAATCDPADLTEATAGDCTFDNVNPGDYWIVESTTPDGYDSDPELPKAITVAVGDDSTDHDYTFTNPRLFTVIVLVCSQADDTLYESEVTFQDETLDSLATGDLDSGDLDGLEAEVCGLGGARFEDHTYGDLNDDDNAVDIPQNQDP